MTSPVQDGSPGRPAGGPAPAVTLVVPAHDEAESLPETLPRLVEFCRERGWILLVVDDGSTDGSGRLLAAARERGDAVVLRHKVRRGYGGAIKSGIRGASTPWVVTVDADGQHHLPDLDGLYEAALGEDADMVVGDRGRRGSGPYRELGKWLIRRIVRMLMPVPVRDLNSGVKLYRTDLAKRYLTVCPDSMAYSDVIALVFLYNGHRVVERPVTVHPRRAGRSTVTTHTAFETVLAVLHIVTLFNPMRIFLPASLVSLAGGVAWGLPIVLRGRGVSVGSMLAILTGVILFALGLLAEQLSALRRPEPPAP